MDYLVELARDPDLYEAIKLNRDLSDLFLVNRRKRLTIDGLFQQAVGGGVHLFAQLFADVDGKDGADAIQSYFGLSFDVGQIVGAIQAVAN